MSPAKPSRGVDCHAHVFSDLAPAIVGARYRPAYEATLGAWQSCWAACGITHGVLVQPSFFGTDNSELLASLALDRRRLRGVAVVDPLIEDAALRRMHACGVRAIRLNLRGMSDYGEYANDAWAELFVRIFALGWHVEIFVDAGRVPEIARILADAPVPLLFDHFGTPGTGDAEIAATFAAVKTLAATRPVFAKLSGPYRLNGGDAHDFAQRWMRIVGPAQLVWGSDWPWTSHEDAGDYGRLRKALEHWVGAERIAAVLWDNAARLYDFPVMEFAHVTSPEGRSC